MTASPAIESQNFGRTGNTERSLTSRRISALSPGSRDDDCSTVVRAKSGLNGVNAEIDATNDKNRTVDFENFISKSELLTQ